MAKLYPIQQSFSSGQVSPFIAARSDLDVYKEGLQTVQNFVPDARGPLRMRTGTRYLARVPGLTGHYTCNILPLDLKNTPQETVGVVYGGKFYIFYADGSNPATIDFPESLGVEHLIQYALTPTNNAFYLVNRNFGPKQITFDGSTWSLGTLQYEGNDVTNLPGSPGSICFYQGRLWMGNFPDAPMKFMGSESGIWNNFAVPTDSPTQSDPVSYTIADAGEIAWMVGQKTLVIGTTYGEFTAQTPEGSAVLGGDVLPDIIQQSAFGTQPIQAEKVAQGIFYVTADSERLRDIRYQWVANGFLSNDVSFLYKGSTSSRGLPVAGKSNHFTKIAYSQNPFSIIWLPDKNGGMSSCAFEMVTGEKSVFGWSTHPTVGSWKSVAVTQTSGRSITWTLADRDDPGSTETDRWLWLEKGMLPDEEVYLDSYATLPDQYVGTPKTELTASEIPHLANLEGKEVRVTVDLPDAPGEGANTVPAPLPVQTVSGGKVTLPQAYPADTRYVVGLPYKGKVVTLPMDRKDAAGSAMGWAKHWNKIILRVFDSGVPMVNGKHPAVNYPSTPMGYGQPLQTDDLIYRSIGWDYTGRITIEQDEPIRTQILGLFGETAFDTL